MASNVTITLRDEVAQTRLTFRQRRSSPCCRVFVWAAYVNKRGPLLCSALHQNLSRIRILILPWALLALRSVGWFADPGTDKQCCSLDLSAFFFFVLFFSLVLFCFFFCNVQFAEARCVLFLSYLKQRLLLGEGRSGENTCRLQKADKACLEEKVLQGLSFLFHICSGGGESGAAPNFQDLEKACWWSKKGVGWGMKTAKEDRYWSKSRYSWSGKTLQGSNIANCNLSLESLSASLTAPINIFLRKKRRSYSQWLALTKMGRSS